MTSGLTFSRFVGDGCADASRGSLVMSNWMTCVDRKLTMMKMMETEGRECQVGWRTIRDVNPLKTRRHYNQITHHPVRQHVADDLLPPKPPPAGRYNY